MAVKIVGDKWLRNSYLRYNRTYFHNELPQNLPVLFKRINEEWAGVTNYDEDGAAESVLIHSDLKKFPRYARIILLHELAHVTVGNKERSYHGPMWRKERKRLVEAGAFTVLL